MHAGDTIPNGNNTADFGNIGCGFKILDVMLKNRGDFSGSEGHSSSLLKQTIR
jgi:hypothetical protein